MVRISVDKIGDDDVVLVLVIAMGNGVSRLRKKGLGISHLPRLGKGECL